MTADQLVSLARELRDLGVSRFSYGDVSVEFSPAVVGVPERDARTQRERVASRARAKELEEARQRAALELDLAAVGP